MKKLRILFGLLILSLSVAGLAVAQTANTGALTGTVSDPGGALVGGVKVTVTNESTGEIRTVTTTDNGAYTVPLLPPGAYYIDFTKSGFKSSVTTGIHINVTETARLDVHLEVGAVTEKVTVTGKTELLQTESSELGGVVTGQMVDNLPLVTRNYTQIVTLSPGIAADVTNATDLGRGGGGESQGNFRANGAEGLDNNFQMNGVQINDLQASGFFSGGIAIPNPDTIEEFKVQTGQFDASYGRSAGANVDVVTKSGSNHFHGTVFEFLRNTDLNANDFFRNETGQPRGVLNQNQFGFTLGGPIIKDKLLFFGSYQGTRQINGISSSSTSDFFSPPFTNDRSAAALGQLFAGQRGELQDAFGGVGPAILANGSNINPAALALLNLKLPDGQFVIPTPQTINTSLPFAQQGFSALSAPATFSEDQALFNVDYLQSDKSKFAAKFFYANSNEVQPFPVTNLGGPASPGWPLSTHDGFENFSLSHSYIFSPTLLNQAEFGFHRIYVPVVQGEAFNYNNIGVTAPPDVAPFPSIFVQGSMTLGGNGQGVTIAQNHYDFEDTLTYIKGKHTFRFGGGVTRAQLNDVGFHYLGGTLFLSWPDLLLGLPGSANGTPFSNVFGSVDLEGQFDRAWRDLDANAYVQDDFKVTPSLTLNLGFRYERLGAIGDALGRNSGFDITKANPNPPAGGTLAGYVVSNNFSGAVPAGVTQVGNDFGIAGDHQNGVAPRLGFALKLPGSLSRTVLRGGYGIYYSRATGQPLFQLLASPPFASLFEEIGAGNANASFTNPFGPAAKLPAFIPYSPATSLSAEIVDQHYRPPSTQEYSLNLQTDLGHNFLLQVGYVGSTSGDEIIALTQNQALLASSSNPIRGVTTNTLANIPLRVPIEGWAPTGITDIQSTARANYNALEVSVTKRLSHGLQFLASYTYSKALSTAGANTTGGGGTLPGDNANPNADYGRSDFNRANRFIIGYLYTFPSPQRFDRVINGVLGGWSVSGVTTIQSGLPLTLTGTNANNVFGITNDRAELAAGCSNGNLVTSGSVTSKLNNYFNADCIAHNAAGPTWPIVGSDGIATAFGNSGVGIVYGPGQNNTDLAVVKRTAVGWLNEGSNVEFRTEFFNAFNHPQFQPPDTDVSSPTFGIISATAVNPRVLQFALKFNF
jgi:hypothetical protein